MRADGVRSKDFMKLQKNDVIDFYDGRRIGCGVVLEVNDRRLRLLTEQGKEVSISSNRVLTSGPMPSFPVSGSRDEQVNVLREIFNRREHIKESIDLAELWEVVGSETRKIEAQDLSELLFGRNQDLDHLSALLRAVFEDRIYFKIRPDGIEVPTQERIEQAFIQRDKELARAQLISRSAELLRRLKSGLDVKPEDAPEGLISMLEEAALSGSDWKTFKSVREIFSEAGLPPDWNPFNVLVRLGVWSEHENLKLRAERIPIEFSPEAIAEATDQASKPLPEPQADLTHLDAITIDAVTTRDVDDALSITRDGPDLTVGIHITDVAHYVEQDSLLDREIRERATSIYLPDMTIPMLPAILSEDAASLIAGKLRPAVSVIATFGPDLDLKHHTIVCSRIEIRERLSYEEVDERVGMKGAPEALMFEVAEALRKKRIEAGALIFKDPEISVHLSENGDIEVTRRDRESPSQILVSELMILANHLFATFLKEKGIPGIFRSQPPPLEKIALGDEDDPVLSYRARRAMARGELSTRPAPHATLGLSAYTTATSPLRRYVDLIIQRQIKAVLMGAPPPVDEKQMEAILSEISFRLERASLMERERQRYFLLRYLESRKTQPFEAVVLYHFPRFYLVQITELGFNVALGNTVGGSLRPYDRVIIRIEKIDPREDKLTVSLGRAL